MTEQPDPATFLTKANNNLAESAKVARVTQLTAAMVTAAGRPWSIEQVIALQRDISFALYPNLATGNI